LLHRAGSGTLRTSLTKITSSLPVFHIYLLIFLSIKINLATMPLGLVELWSILCNQVPVSTTSSSLAIFFVGHITISVFNDILVVIELLKSHSDTVTVLSTRQLGTRRYCRGMHQHGSIQLITIPAFSIGPLFKGRQLVVPCLLMGRAPASMLVRQSQEALI
jgi:hypothetical protein